MITFSVWIEHGLEVTKFNRFRISIENGWKEILVESI